MRKLISCFWTVAILMLAIAVVPAGAKNDSRTSALCFVYVAPSSHTSLESVVEYLDSRYERAVNDEEFVLIIYMADKDEPTIVRINADKDNREDYGKLIEELRGESYGPLYPDYDLERIVELFDEIDFVTEGSNILNYRSVDWHFHVTSDFWNNNYNESLIASLCFVMGVEHFETDNFRLRCYFSRDDAFTYDPEFPFGARNFCDMEFKPFYY
jgi:hypothetical protein